MNSRTRFLITAAFVCHLLLAPALVTSQLLSSSNQPGALPIAPSAVQGEEVTIRAQEQEKDGPVFKLRGQAEIHYRTYILYADEVTYNSQTGDATADGHAVLDGGPNDEHIEASHALYNIRTETGTFENVVGTIGMRVRGKSLILTSSNPFAFTGKKVVKTGPDHYVVYDGTVTSCELPHPKWEFKAHKVLVDVGGNATIYRSTFRIKGIPIVYFPFATHPVERLARQSGFLMPSFGQSSRKGTILGESVYWAISPSMDARVGAEYYSSRGWSQQGEFRAEPSEHSFVDLNYFGVLDRGIEQSQLDPTTGKAAPVHVDQGGQDVRLDAQSTFAHNFRGVTNIDYLSSFVFRLAFNEIFSQAVHSEVQSQAFLSNTTRGFSFNASAQRYQNFESTTPGDVITIVHAPGFESSSVDRQIGHSPFYWSYDAAGEGVSRKDCEQLNLAATACRQVFSTPLVGRFDLNPTLSMPLLLHGWSLRPEISLRDTYYTRELSTSFGTDVAANDPVNRKSVEGSVELRPPALDRVFSREFMGRKWKHVIEPRVTYRYLTGIDNFASILRFDARDILTDTNEVEYAIVNRLYAKRTSQQPEDCGPAGMPSLIIGREVPQPRVPWERQTTPQEVPCKAGPQVREVVTWELAQKYFLDPTFGGALIPGRRNVLTTTADLTGIAFLTDARRLSPLISRLRIQATSRTDAEWDLDYDFKKGLINASTALVNYRVGQFTFGAGDAYLRAQGESMISNSIPSTSSPSTPRFNQFRLLLGYGHPNKRGLSAAANVGFDANLGFLQYSAVQAAYNWDCCGVSLEYRRFALGSVRNENQFRFTFALSNIGAFGNLKREEKLF
ncbi:MAG: LPS assembly protein LptD [Acidobacteriia bacterium]|nr:LPS assembly protein LptD [Terriglobia bacterium]